MESSIELSSMVALFGAMMVLAIVPDASVIAVVGRSMASGYTHGLVTVIGILVGDLVFLMLAIYGLSAIAETMGDLFVVVKYLGGAYLIWFGLGLWRARSITVEVEEIQETSWVSNFLGGLTITLGDPKAILFYLSFLPAFLDLIRVSILDMGIIMVLAAISVGGTKLGYAYMADTARSLFESSRARMGMHVTAGSVMIGTGIFLVLNMSLRLIGPPAECPRYHPWTFLF